MTHTRAYLYLEEKREIKREKKRVETERTLTQYRSQQRECTKNVKLRGHGHRVSTSAYSVRTSGAAFRAYFVSHSLETLDTLETY